MLRDMFKGVIYEVEVWMNAFGGTSPKRTWLLSNLKTLDSLKLPFDSSNVPSAKTYEKTFSESGKVQISGTKQLKGTEAYPDAFGKSVAALYFNEVVQERFGDGVSLAALETIPTSNDPWSDANLDIIISDLERLQKHKASHASSSSAGPA